MCPSYRELIICELSPHWKKQDSESFDRALTLS